jgi:hypothetical protein
MSDHDGSDEGSGDGRQRAHVRAHGHRGKIG